MPRKMQNEFLGGILKHMWDWFLTFYFQLYNNRQNYLENSMAFLILGHVKKQNVSFKYILWVVYWFFFQNIKFELLYVINF